MDYSEGIPSPGRFLESYLWWLRSPSNCAHCFHFFLNGEVLLGLRKRWEPCLVAGLDWSWVSLELFTRLEVTFLAHLALPTLWTSRRVPNVHVLGPGERWPGFFLQGAVVSCPKILWLSFIMQSSRHFPEWFNQFLFIGALQTIIQFGQVVGRIHIPWWGFPRGSPP